VASGGVEDAGGGGGAEGMVATRVQVRDCTVMMDKDDDV
jgi:hypothetical protein